MPELTNELDRIPRAPVVDLLGGLASGFLLLLLADASLDIRQKAFAFAYAFVLLI
jgi:hypothetical protein